MFASSCNLKSEASWDHRTFDSIIWNPYSCLCCRVDFTKCGICCPSVCENILCICAIHYSVHVIDNVIAHTIKLKQSDMLSALHKCGSQIKTSQCPCWRMEMSSKMSRTHLLLFALFCGLCHCQYDDYGPPPDNPGGESGPGSGDVFGSGDFGPASGSASGSGSLTTKAPSTTTKKPTATTKAPTTLKPSGKTVVFPKL